jgi:hypothetical protein
MSGQSSGTYTWAPSGSDIVLEALQRCQIRGAEITREHIIEASRSVNLELQVWGTRGITLYQVVEGFVIPLVAPTGQIGQTTYVMPSNCLQVLNVRYNQPMTGGGTTDRILLPIGRDDYAAYPNKQQIGIPTVFWAQRVIPYQITIWQPDQFGPPYTLTCDYLRQSQDMVLGAGQTPDAPPRFLDALSARLAWRLARKFWSDLVRASKMTETAALEMVKDLKAEAEEAWQIAALDDQETAPLQIGVDLSDYFRP